jgi:hypothetical protein
MTIGRFAILVACMALGACAWMGGSASNSGGAAEVARCIVYDVRGGTITCAPPEEARAGDRCICTDPEVGVLYVGRVQITR